ncbi:sialate O-acetylesterase [Cloacibacterium sp.]|uniref:sialate O-acetylesterase n=1 Tax=Cloacibacterium sp. TaxID=1913682 RepID=UPI0039E4A095
MKKQFTFLSIFLFLLGFSNVKLPLIFSDGMVFQRNKKIPVWGWAEANEKIDLHFNKQHKTVITDANGKWMVNLDPENAGGPFQLTVSGKNKITIQDILVGEVWICSGQSNMEFQMYKLPNFKALKEKINNSEIRQFGVAQDLSGSPKEQLKQGKWQLANKENLADFTAVGYFFAEKLNKELHVPIGIINTSWGGTCVETWTSREAFQKSDEFKEMIAQVPVVDMDAIFEKYKKSVLDNIQKIQGFDVSKANEEQFHLENFDDSKWPEIKVPSLWENQQIGNIDGEVWMRKSFEISPEQANKEAVLYLSKVDDEDITYINGVKIGSMNLWDSKRIYKIPAGVLKQGRNTIAVKVIDYTGGGGIYGDSGDLKIEFKDSNIPLSGLWKFNVVKVKLEISPNSYPSLLYNAMIHPLIPYAFNGVLWYQGEANVTRANQYKIAFPQMINDWRNQWKQGDFPFYFVQLATYNENNGNSNFGSKWAELREAQSEALKLKNTGMSITTDIGDPKDIHPTNKLDVGLRLAAIALNKTYGIKTVPYSGPVYKSSEVKGNTIVLTFDFVGKGLQPENQLKGFEIAGEDKVFYPAVAVIQNNKVIVNSDKVAKPVSVRYNWADDASAGNLYNLDKLPAAPFRTDNWELTTAKEKYTISK